MFDISYIQRLHSAGQQDKGLRNRVAGIHRKSAKDSGDESQEETKE